jgi:hypothetical protein
MTLFGANALFIRVTLWGRAWRRIPGSGQRFERLISCDLFRLNGEGVSKEREYRRRGSIEGEGVSMERVYRRRRHIDRGRIDGEGRLTERAYRRRGRIDGEGVSTERAYRRRGHIDIKG